MTETADVVIIGGGIIGSSIAYHLTEQGCTRVLVIEREAHQGKGSTGKSMGGVRAQFATPVNIEMSLYSINFFATFDEVVGHPADYRPHGYLFAATSERHMDYLKANHRRQQALGLKTVEFVSREDILKAVPQLYADDILGGTYCPTDGFVDPHSVMMGFMLSARGRGARLWLDTAVTGIDVERGQVTSVQTTRGPISTRAVVNASGAWAAEVARLAGADLPVVPLRRQLVPTEPFDQLPARFPMVIDMSTGFHFRREGLRILLAWNDPTETPGYKTDFDPAFVEKILTRAAARVPCLSEAAVNPRRAWAGLYEMTPDHHAIIGRAPSVSGLYFANGFSGHGVMHSPAAGRAVSDLILHGESRLLDITPLGVERFSEGRLIEETSVL
ncbi:MAG TPA: FAD-dependent oxidoreductase [Pyrinomonadaceae bacterium]|nr:FAD-dependent oxidoreductase [Pyrinomonadaceae bacterium]